MKIKNLVVVSGLVVGLVSGCGSQNNAGSQAPIPQNPQNQNQNFNGNGPQQGPNQPGNPNFQPSGPQNPQFPPMGNPNNPGNGNPGNFPNTPINANPGNPNIPGNNPNPPMSPIGPTAPVQPNMPFGPGPGPMPQDPNFGYLPPQGQPVGYPHYENYFQRLQSPYGPQPVFGPGMGNPWARTCYDRRIPLPRFNEAFYYFSAIQYGPAPRPAPLFVGTVTVEMVTEIYTQYTGFDIRVFHKHYQRVLRRGLVGGMAIQEAFFSMNIRIDVRRYVAF